MVDKQVSLTVTILSKINKKCKPLAFYTVFFAVEMASPPGNTSSTSQPDPQIKPKRPIRPRY